MGRDGTDGLPTLVRCARAPASSAPPRVADATVLHRVRSTLGSYPELVTVVLASVVGLTVQSPLRWLVDHRGIDVLLVALIFATAVTITVDDIGRAAGFRVRLAIALLAGTTVLPAMAWLAARLVVAGPLRDGVLTIGVAPCEIASVAAVAIAGGQPAVAAVLLIGSTMLSVALAGPILVLERGTASIRPAGLVVNLVVVVVVPLVIGILARARAGLGAGRERLTGLVSTAAVAALVALIASRVELSRDYVAVVAAMILFTAGAAGLGRVLSVGAPPSVRTAMLLTASMRDFAIAAGIAASAFGARAAAPLGLYGIVVLTWGTAAAGILRQRTGRRPVPG